MAPEFLISGEIGDRWGEGTTFGDIYQFIQDNSEASELRFVINSPGGSVTEGFQIAGLIEKTAKEKTVVVEGYQVMSIATVIFLAANPEQRFISPNAEFMIHAPWTYGGGDADDFRKIAETLDAHNDRILDYYEDKTGTPRADLEPMMKEDTYLTKDQVLSLGFASSELLEPQAIEVKRKIKAVALLPGQRKTSNTNMDLSKFTDALRNVVRGEIQNAVNLSVALQSGEMLNVQTRESEAKEGDTVSINGNTPEDGEYIGSEKGTVYTVADGKIASVDQPEPEPAVNQEEITAMVKDLIGNEIQGLKAEIVLAQKGEAEAKASVVALQAQLQAKDAEITALKAQVASNYVPPTERVDDKVRTDAPEVVDVPGFEYVNPSARIKEIAKRNKR